MQEERQAVQEQLGGSIERIEVGRLTVVDDLLQFYREHLDICELEIRVTFCIESS